MVADVSGHGPSAALIMSMVKGVFHASAKKMEHLDKTLEEINRVVAEILPDEIFITMMFLLIDSRQKKLHFSNAGHTPLLYYDAIKGTANPLITKGCALNVMTGARYEQKSVDFKSGDVFLVYTDGIIEAVNNDKEMFSIDRMARCLARSGKGQPDDIIRDMEQKLHSFTGKSEWEDDIVLLAAKIL